MKVLGNEKSIKAFVCLQGNCFHDWEEIKLNNSSTSDGCKHLKEIHNVLSAKTKAHQRNVKTLNKFIENADRTFQRDPSRWRGGYLSSTCTVQLHTAISAS